MKSWKRNAIVATVLLFVCAGIYLNWSFNQSQSVMDLTETLDADKVMGDTTLVSSDETDPSAPTSTLDALANQDAKSVSDYFAEVRLSRQASRDCHASARVGACQPGRRLLHPRAAAGTDSIHD